MSRTQILLLILIISIFFNVYTLYQISKIPKEKKIHYSEHENPLGGIEIEAKTAIKLVDEYTLIHPSPETRGFLFSRKAFESIFQTDSNAVAMYLIGKDKNNLHAIIRGTNSENTGITDLLGSRIFLGQSLCPKDCSDW